MIEEKTLNSIKKLGFGLMRLPMNGGEIDLAQTRKMADLFMEKGFTYFDTAYPYIGGKSECAVKDALVARYPRESFYLADKLPPWAVKEPADCRKIFDTQLSRTGAGYFDFYLLHALDKDKLKILDDNSVWEFARELKEKGLIRHLGFSFHDTADVLEKILSGHPEMEFVQLQINYADWDSDSVQSRLCYETARRHEKPVIVMEPVKGGSLAMMTDEITGLFKTRSPGLSVASWAVRFAASLPGVLTVLSGMSNLEQMEDNLSYMEHFSPLSPQEQAVIGKVSEILRNTPTVPCTKCQYCVDGCPQGINIPGIFAALNHFKVYGNPVVAKNQYKGAVKDKGRASDCIACGNCESHCPQHIEIIETLKEAAKRFE